MQTHFLEPLGLLELEYLYNTNPRIINHPARVSMNRWSN